MLNGTFKARGFSLFCALSFFSLLNAFAYQSRSRETIWDEIMLEQSMINMRRGVYHMEAERYIKAANEFIKAITKNPYDANPHVFYGSSLYWLGDVDKALHEYSLALKFDSKNPLAFQLMAIAYAYKGDMSKALKYFLEAEKYGPERSDIKMNLGSVYHSLGNFDKSLFYFRKALKLEPKNPLYNFQLASLYKRLGRYYDSLRYMSAASTYDRTYEDAIFELGTIYEKLGARDKAISSYKRALRLKPLDGAARFRLSGALFKSGQPGKIEKYLIEAFSLTPQNKKGGISLNLVYSGRVKRHKEADNKPQVDGKKPQKNGGSENDILNSIESSLRKIKNDEDIKLKVEFLSLPKVKIVSSSQEKRNSLSAGLNKRLEKFPSPNMEQNINKPKVSYRKKEYFIGEVENKNREDKILGIIKEINKILSGSKSDEDVRVSVSIETSKRRASSLSAAGSEGPLKDDAPRVAYKPRIVGNDMGLWVVGRNWLENVEEGLIDFEDFLARSLSGEPMADAIMGLGNLILGRADRAEYNFDKIKSSLPLLHHLGMSVMFVEKGNEKKALYHSNEVLKIDAKNKIALRNKRWLEMPVIREERRERRGQ